jgi:hypothetical protein
MLDFYLKKSYGLINFVLLPKKDKSMSLHFFINSTEMNNGHFLLSLVLSSMKVLIIKLNTLNLAQNYWGFGLCPLSHTPKMGEHDILETDPIAETLCPKTQ